MSVFFLIALKVFVDLIAKFLLLYFCLTFFSIISKWLLSFKMRIFVCAIADAFVGDCGNLVYEVRISSA